MKNTRYKPHEMVADGARRHKQNYGKRSLAFQLISRGKRLRNIVRMIVAGAVMASILVSVYE